MKENSIREDIERLKLCSTNQCHICGRYEKEECMLERNRCEQHLLSSYKRVLKINEVLLKENEELNKENEHLHREINRRIKLKIENEKIVDTQFIYKQKIKDKIEELNNRIEKYREYLEQGIATNVEWVDNVADRETVKVLQELLEGRK